MLELSDASSLREKNEREIQFPRSERTNVEMLINEKLQYIAQSMLSDQEFSFITRNLFIFFYSCYKNYEQIYK